ncbi:hypothetical protein Leryth_005024 [Lithospermum erythrorhizon]|nr:hypothetical protein Leryth_005024 [Lithospermum erythrorhizon]
MAAIWVHQFADCITCHSWSPDQSMIAFCPNNSEVHIYRLLDDKWEKLYVLQKHDQIVSGIDWSARSNKIVTVSHDRNSYVWNKEGAEWVPTLVILRLNRAALCVQWKNKFAVGSGAKTVCICYYEQENNWWVSKLIRKRHESSVTSVAWHPNNILLATTSTDGKCRVFSTFIKGIDTKDSRAGASADTKFGEVLFISEKVVIGVGFDCNPMVFSVDETGLWHPLTMLAHIPGPIPLAGIESGSFRTFLRFLGERRSASSGVKSGSQFSEAFGKFYGQSKNGSSNDETSKGHGVHNNCIKAKKI